MSTIAVFSRVLEYYPVFLIVYKIYSSVITQHRIPNCSVSIMFGVKLFDSNMEKFDSENS